MTTLNSIPNPSALGQPVLLSAVISARTLASARPTGTVSLQEIVHTGGPSGPDQLVTLGTRDLLVVFGSVGVAVFSTSRLSAGTHRLIAVYGGDNNFEASTSTELAQTVNTGTPFTPNQRFVSQVYLDVLFRAPEPGGLAFWTAALDRGISRTDVVRSIDHSPERVTRGVEGFYGFYLHRAADPQGASTWVHFLNAGGSSRALQGIFLSSAEYFQSRGGGTNSGFLDAVYQDVLRRPIDDPARAAFGQALDSGQLSRAQVVAALFGSLEYRQVVVQGIFTFYLHRPVDPVGLQTFTEALRKGAQYDDILARILGADEYFART